MQDQIAEILGYVRGTLKYKWAAVIVAWSVCVAGWIFVSAMPDKYASEAKVHVETRTMLQPLLQGMTIQSDVRGLLRVMQLLMFTQNNLEQIVNLSELSKTVKTPSQQIELFTRLKKDIEIQGGHEDIFSIKYEAADPEVAKSVVQAVLTVFSEQAHMRTLEGADVAQRFINEQIQEYETRLRNAEKARENFKRANFGLLPGEGDQISQVQSANNMLEDAKLQLNEAISRRSVLLSQLNEIKDSDEDWGVTDFGETSLSEEDARIDALRNIKKELLVKYTENHPQIISINKTINELERRKQNAASLNTKDESPKDLFATPSVMANPYVQTIKIALNEAEAEVATYEARVNELKQRMDRINQELNTRLTIETELQNLNRDYDSVKSNYDKLIASREQAKMSEKVDNQAEALKFKIADAPNTPLKPSSPNRPLLFTAVLFAGIILGFLSAFLLYFIKPTIMSTLQLRQLTGLPVLGNVSLKANPTRVNETRKDMLKYGATALGLFLIYLGFMATDLLNIKLIDFSALLQSVN